MTNFRYGSIVPLIGGLLVANKQVIGHNPSLMLSYTPFRENEKSIKAYFPMTPHHNLDDPESMKSFNPSFYQDLDSMSAVCPCAGLSMLSKGSQEQRNSMNSWLFKSASYVMKELRPKVYWGENAPALFTTAGKEVRDGLREIGKQNGYSMSLYATNTALHGIPQIRKRSFYFFWRDTNAPIFEYYDRLKKNLGEYLAEVPAGINGQDYYDIAAAKMYLTANPYMRYLSTRAGEKLTGVRDWLETKGINTITLARYIQVSDQLEEACKFLENGDKEMVAAAKELRRIKIKTDAGKGVWDSSLSVFNPKMDFLALVHRKLESIHPVEDRIITKRECMHLMGLPHDFRLMSEELNHVCQNVPVCTGADMTREVVAYLQREREISSASFIMQSNNSQQVVYSESSYLEF